MKKILMITDLFPDGGVPNWTLTVIGALKDLAVFKVVSYARAQEVMESEIWKHKNVTWYPAPILSLRHGLAIADMWRVMRCFRPDYIVCHSIYLAISLLCARLFVFRHIPLMIVVHGISVNSKKKRHKEYLTCRLISLLLHPQKDVFVAVAPYLEDYLKRVISENFDIVVIPNGIEPKPHSEERIEQSSQYCHLAFVGRLSHEKGPDLFLQVARKISDSRIRFHIVGDGPMREEVERCVKEFGLEPYVIFHGWIKDVCPLMRGMDALLITSRSEGLPYVVLEAFSCGVPVISFAAGGLPFLLQYGRGGNICADVSTMAKIVKSEILDTRTRSERKAENSAEFLRDELHICKMIESYRRIWKI